MGSVDWDIVEGFGVAKVGSCFVRCLFRVERWIRAARVVVVVIEICD